MAPEKAAFVGRLVPEALLWERLAVALVQPEVPWAQAGAPPWALPQVQVASPGGGLLAPLGASARCGPEAQGALEPRGRQRAWSKALAWSELALWRGVWRPA